MLKRKDFYFYFFKMRKCKDNVKKERELKPNSLAGGLE